MADPSDPHPFHTRGGNQHIVSSRLNAELCKKVNKCDWFIGKNPSIPQKTNRTGKGYLICSQRIQNNTNFREGGWYMNRRREGGREEGGE